MSQDCHLSRHFRIRPFFTMAKAFPIRSFYFSHFATKPKPIKIHEHLQLLIRADAGPVGPVGGPAVAISRGGHFSAVHV